MTSNVCLISYPIYFSGIWVLYSWQCFLRKCLMTVKLLNNFQGSHFKLSSEAYSEPWNNYFHETLYLRCLIRVLNCRGISTITQLYEVKICNKQIFHAFLFNIRNYSPEVINIQRHEMESNKYMRIIYFYVISICGYFTEIAWHINISVCIL